MFKLNFAINWTWAVFRGLDKNKKIILMMHIYRNILYTYIFTFSCNHTFVKMRKMSYYPYNAYTKMYANNGSSEKCHNYQATFIQ